VATLNPLVSTEWLEGLLHDETLRIADCRWFLTEPARGRQEYLTAHIPTARYFSLDDDLAATTGPGRHPLPGAKVFAEEMGRVGIGSEHTVVAYDDSGGAYAARLWWMLRSLGHEKVHVINGGWKAWSNEPRSTTTEIPTWEPTVLNVASEWTGVVDRKQIASDGDGMLLLDARTPERYRGEEEPIDPVAGHIPGAFNIPFAGNVGESGHFLPVEELKKRFSAASSGLEVVNYCGSGVTSCHNVLALEVIGHTDALLYPGSWSDWCTSGGEVATQNLAAR